MKRGLYFKLAFTNIRKNKNSFFPFLLSAVAMVAMFYMLLSISQQSDGLYYGAEYMSQILGFGVWIAGIISVIIIFYTNSFLMKQRNQEIGLYNVLGMEKKHIARVLTWEIAIVAVGGIITGLVLGIVFSKLMFLILIRMVGLSPKFHFSISKQAVLVTIIVFAAVFAAAVLLNLIKAARLKPVELMRETHAGEKEPKAKWLLAFLGIVALGIGYEIALTTENPLEALNSFFVAVILVIVGTYLLFMAGSIVLLKLLKKNKNFYYHRTHFVTVSGMMYRMKQNALGLASICILVTMVIVVLSTTVSLYAGVEEEQRYRYPKDVSIYIYYDGGSQREVDALRKKLDKVTQKLAKKKNVSVKGKEAYCDYTVLLCQDKKDSFSSYASDDYSLDELLTFNIMLLSEYNELTGESLQNKGEAPILLTGRDTKIYGDSIRINEKEIFVQKEGDIDEKFTDSLYQEAVLLVSDYDEILKLREQIGRGKDPEDNTDNVRENYTFDLSGKWEDKEAYGKNLKKYLEKNGIETWVVEDYYSSWQYSIGLYASIFFIGIFIGILFIVATVLIIYYKQISEGYEDQKNFQIMRKIGLANREISHIINSQIRMIFLLPIVVAVVHICFAFPIIKNIMKMLNLTNEKLFGGCTVGTVLAFFLIYMVVYKITSRVYYRIVERI